MINTEPTPDYNSPAALKLFMESKGLSMQKKFGQNFLVNGDARKRLIDTLEVDKDMTVWEVGPGLGAMTALLLERGANVTVFEIDHGFARLLPGFFNEYAESGHFTLVEGDVLKTWQNQLSQSAVPARFFGNLPYNVAATIIADTINAGVRFDRAVFTIQKEVAARMCAKPGTEDYSSFSVLCQWAYTVKPVMDLAGGNFWPQPNVSSRAVVMDPRSDFPRCTDPALFMKLQRSLFSARRKTLKNNLTVFMANAANAESVLSSAKLDGMRRAETLSIEEMLMLSDEAAKCYNPVKEAKL